MALLVAAFHLGVGQTTVAIGSPATDKNVTDAKTSKKPSLFSSKRWKNLTQPRQMHVRNAPDGLQQLATDIVLENLPETHDDRRKWGMTRARFDGLHVRMDGFQIRTKRKRKEVNHGTWKRYKITQINPDENLKVKISPARTMPDGRAAFEVELSARINSMARLSEWNRGIRLVSVSVDADTDVKIVIDCRLDVQLDPTRLPPDVILKPEVVNADIEISKFRINRISHMEGALARELSRGLQKLLEKKIDEKRPKLVKKINRQIKKHEDDLRISMHDAIKEKWNSFVDGQ